MLEQKYISTDTMYWVKERQLGNVHVNVPALAFLSHLLYFKIFFLTCSPVTTLYSFCNFFVLSSFPVCCFMSCSPLYSALQGLT